MERRDQHISSDLTGVWGSGAADVWAVGIDGSEFLRWGGSAWSSVAISTGSQLRGVWGSGSRDIWAVGGSSITANGVRWNGSTGPIPHSRVSIACAPSGAAGRMTSGPSG